MARAGPGGRTQPGVGTGGTHWESSAGPGKMQVLGGNTWVLAGALTQGQEHGSLGGPCWPGWTKCRSGSCGLVYQGTRQEHGSLLSFWSCTWGTKNSLKPGLAYTWRSPAARGPVSILECKMWALEVPQRPARPVPSLHRAQRGSEACPRSHGQPKVELSPQTPYKPDTGSQISAWNSAFSYHGFA